MPRLKGFPLELRIGQGSEKTKVMALPDGRKSFKIGLAVLIHYRRVTDTQPASQPHSCSIYRAMLCFAWVKMVSVCHVLTLVGTGCFVFADLMSSMALSSISWRLHAVIGAWAYKCDVFLDGKEYQFSYHFFSLQDFQLSGSKILPKVYILFYYLQRHESDTMTAFYVLENLPAVHKNVVSA